MILRLTLQFTHPILILPFSSKVWPVLVCVSTMPILCPRELAFVIPIFSVLFLLPSSMRMASSMSFCPENVSMSRISSIIVGVEVRTSPSWPTALLRAFLNCASSWVLLISTRRARFCVRRIVLTSVLLSDGFTFFLMLETISAYDLPDVGLMIIASRLVSCFFLALGCVWVGCLSRDPQVSGFVATLRFFLDCRTFHSSFSVGLAVDSICGLSLTTILDLLVFTQ